MEGDRRRCGENKCACDPHHTHHARTLRRSLLMISTTRPMKHAACPRVPHRPTPISTRRVRMRNTTNRACSRPCCASTRPSSD
eukprot:3992751-Alexandrium_andersonii.AAC.1